MFFGILSRGNGFYALGSVLVWALTAQLISGIGFAVTFRIKALLTHWPEVVGLGLHLLVRISLLLGLSVYLWPRFILFPYMLVSIGLGLCAALRGVLVAMRERRVAAEDPADWQFVERVNDDIERRVRENFQANCQNAANMYPFSLDVERVYAIQNPVLHFGDVRANVQSLYHGTSNSGAKDIARQGFRLPARPGMFGRGLYFADTPLKSWQYSVMNCSKYILVCDVALGRALKQERSNMLLTGRVLMRLGYDSSLGLSRHEGGELRLAEYTTYHEDQVVPRFLLEVTETRNPPPTIAIGGSAEPLLLEKCA